MAWRCHRAIASVVMVSKSSPRIFRRQNSSQWIVYGYMLKFPLVSIYYETLKNILASLPVAFLNTVYKLKGHPVSLYFRRSRPTTNLLTTNLRCWCAVICPPFRGTEAVHAFSAEKNMWIRTWIANTLGSHQNVHQFTKDLFKYFFLNDRVAIVIRISFPIDPMANHPA